MQVNQKYITPLHYTKDNTNPLSKLTVTYNRVTKTWDSYQTFYFPNSICQYRFIIYIIKYIHFLAEKVKSIAIVEKNTQNRLSQELPGCNWLEQKIKSGEGSQNIQRQISKEFKKKLDIID